MDFNDNRLAVTIPANERYGNWKMTIRFLIGKVSGSPWRLSPEAR